MAVHTFRSIQLLQRQRSEQIMDAFLTKTMVRIRGRTPIDTGFARSRWRRDPPGLAKFGLPWRVLNDASYIEELEFGKSRQAPQGMVRITFAESQQRFDETVREFSR